MHLRAILHLISDDTWWAESQNGIFEIQIATEKEPPVEVPLLIEIEKETNTLIGYKRDYSIASESNETNRMQMFLAKIIVGEDNEITEADVDIIEKEAKFTQDILRDSFPNLNITVIGGVRKVPEGTRISIFGDVWGFLDAPEGTTHRHARGGVTSSVSGRALIGGTKAVSFLNGSIGTVIHESGHMIGMGHSGKGQRVYGETKAWMGNSPNRLYFNAPHLWKVGAIPNELVTTAAGSDNISMNLVDADAPLLSVREGEQKLIELSYNSAAPSRKLAVSFQNEQIYIHSPWNTATDNWIQTRQIDNLRKGQTWEDSKYDTRITFHDVTDFSAAVTCSKLSENISPPTPIINTTPEGINFNSQSGWYGNNAWSVQGLSIFYLQDRNKILVEWLGWLPSKQSNGRIIDSEQMWAFGVWDITNNFAQGTLTAGIPNPFTGIIDVREVGSGSIYFPEDGKCLFQATHERLGRFTMPAERIAKASDHPLTGRWGLGNKEGFIAGVADHGKVVGYHLHYGNRSQKWNMIIGDDLNDLEIKSISGGYPGIKADVVNTTIGTASISLDSKQMSLNIDNSTIAKNMHKLA